MIADIDPATDPLWAALVTRHAAGLFHSPLWLGAVQHAYGLPIRAKVLVNAGGDAVAGVAYANLDGPPARRILSAPFCDTCDPLFGDPAEWAPLLESLLAFDLPLNLRCLGELPEKESFTISKRARWHIIALRESSEVRWNALHPAARRAIQRARRSGIAVRPLGRGADVAAFHRLHVRLRKSKYRMLAQPLAFFDEIAERFSAAGSWHSLGAWTEDRLIAGTIYLRWGDTLYYKFNASSLDALDGRPNNLLVWEGMELASAMGCRYLDLGPSDDAQPGLIRFKRQFGTDVRELAFLRRDPAGWDDRARLSTLRLLGEMTELLTRPDVPDQVSADAGAAFYRYFA